MPEQKCMAFIINLLPQIPAACLAPKHTLKTYSAYIILIYTCYKHWHKLSPAYSHFSCQSMIAQKWVCMCTEYVSTEYVSTGAQVSMILDLYFSQCHVSYNFGNAIQLYTSTLTKNRY